MNRKNSKTDMNYWLMAGIILNAIILLIKELSGVESDITCFLQGAASGFILLGLAKMVFSMDRIKRMKHNIFLKI